MCFGDIAWDGNGSATHLLCQSEHLDSGKFAGDAVDLCRQAATLLPYIQITIIAHTHSWCGAKARE
jgi:hypothetical protein